MCSPDAMIVKWKQQQQKTKEKSKRMQYFPVAYFLVGYPCWNEYVTTSANQWKFQR